jgi:glycosyltransferase involved in cell wall biosynthesis
MHRRFIRRRTHMSVREADLVNVANHDDRAELIRSGVPADKITVIPYGISQRRRTLFNAVSSVPPLKPKVAFVGSFDARKGAIDFPNIVRAISKALPDVTFRLLGTIKTEDEVLSHFPENVRGRIEVISKYVADELPQLLATCSVGIFPSYIEGFGFGVLEMLAASVPVIAYSSPGPPMMLSTEYLVPRGDTTALSGKVVDLLGDRNKLIQAREIARRRSREFCWERIARQTSQIYLERVHKLRQQQPSSGTGASDVNQGAANIVHSKTIAN